METQRKQIKEYLEKGNAISALEALLQFGCFRLSAVIFVLKGRGMNILSQWEESINTKGKKDRYKIYYLDKFADLYKK